jgi:hypothetical protein
MAACLAALLYHALAASAAPEPVRLHPDNPHYFLWRGKPTILLTASEHYGAVINLDFDYGRYLDELKKHRLNLARVFSGAYRERAGTFHIAGNTLAPAAGRFLCPWARSAIPAQEGRTRFDLTRWDETYFARLKRFVAQADEHGVIVELVFFCIMYDDSVWSASPMNARNNVNGIGQVERNQVYAGRDARLLDVQQAMVRKIVTELNPFANVYFEVCNEPHERDGVTEDWNNRIIQTVVETEAKLSNQHLIAQGFPGTQTALAGVNRHVSILNFHYATARTVQVNYGWNRVVAFDETGGSDRSDRRYRLQAWEFILGGGGVFDHLDFSFTAGHEDGSAPLPAGTPGGGSAELRRQLGILKEFIEGFDFLRMTPDSTTVRACRAVEVQEPPATGKEITAHCLAERGRAYAVHVRGGIQTELTLALPSGRYQVDWMNPRSGRVEKSESFLQEKGDGTVLSPPYIEDIAARIVRAR